MVKDVLTVEPSDTIGEAAEKMHAANVGAVVVVEDMVRVVGIVTERDLLRAVAQRARAAAVGRPEEIPGLAEQYDVIGIDEVQFFAQEIVLVIDALVEHGKRVVVSGLDQDFRGLPFGAMPELLCRAELVDKLQAVCHRCGGPATMTQRLIDGRPASADGATIVVGALDSYEARCRSCHELAEPDRATG